MQDAWMDRLSEYLDGDMDRSERASLETHLERCAECAAVLEDLQRVRARAQELGAMRVPADLWPRIEAAIAEGRIGTSPAAPGSLVPARVTRLGPARGGRTSFSLPELLAACLAVAIISGGAVYALLRHQAPAPKAEQLAGAGTPAPRTPQGAASERPAPGNGGGGPARG